MAVTGHFTPDTTSAPSRAGSSPTGNTRAEATRRPVTNGVALSVAYPMPPDQRKKATVQPCSVLGHLEVGGSAIRPECGTVAAVSIAASARAALTVNARR